MGAFIVYVLPFDHPGIFCSVATATEQPSPAVAYGYDEAESCEYTKIILYLVEVIFAMNITFEQQ